MKWIGIMCMAGLGAYWAYLGHSFKTAEYWIMLAMLAGAYVGAMCTGIKVEQ